MRVTLVPIILGVLGDRLMASREALRMRAQYMNDIASGVAVASVVAPVFTLLVTGEAVNWLSIAGLFLLALVLSLILHDMACRVSTGLEGTDE